MGPKWIERNIRCTALYIPFRARLSVTVLLDKPRYKIADETDAEPDCCPGQRRYSTFGPRIRAFLSSCGYLGFDC